MPKNTGRMIYFGGSFNPLHIGHMRVALETMEIFRNAAEKLVFLPSFVPPHKDSAFILPFNLRLAMIKSVISSRSDMECSPIESVMPQPSYTYSSMVAVDKNQEGTQPFFLLGSQDFKMLPTWEKGLRLPEVCTLIIEQRGKMDREEFYNQCQEYWPQGYPEKNIRDMFGDMKVICYNIPGNNPVYMEFIHYLDISSTMIRNMWLRSENIDYLVPGAVLDLLTRHRDDIRAVWQETDAKC